MSEKYKAVQVHARTRRAELAPQLNGARSKEFIETTSERLTVGSGRASAALSLDNGTEQRSGLTLLKPRNSGHSHRIPLFRANGELVPFSRVVQSSAKTSWKHVVMEQSKAKHLLETEDVTINKTARSRVEL
jgi:hypothetical protein